MADATTTEDAPKPAKKGLRTMMVMGGLLVGEAALILGIMMVLGGPADVEASGALDNVEMSEDDKIVEQLVVDGRFPNSRRGATYVYDTEVYVQVQRRHRDRVLGELEQFRNEIKAELTAIWRTSDPRHFDEPKLENLTRKVYALMNERFGSDQDSGEPVVAKVVIVMGTGLRVEG